MTGERPSPAVSSARWALTRSSTRMGSTVMAAATNAAAINQNVMGRPCASPNVSMTAP